MARLYLFLATGGGFVDSVKQQLIDAMMLPLRQSPFFSQRDIVLVVWGRKASADGAASDIEAMTVMSSLLLLKIFALSLVLSSRRTALTCRRQHDLFR